MKYIIIGLGSFGSSLAIKLTEQGNEVIGVDKAMNKVEFLKDKITHTICMDCTDQNSVLGLPLKETDIVIVSIGESEGAAILVTALMKQLKVKRLISRAVSPLHETVLQAMGIEEIVNPEEETAERLSKRLNIKGIVDSFEVSGEYSIIEAKVPDRFVGKTIDEVGFRKKYNVVVLTTLKITVEKNILGLSRKISNVEGVATPNTILSKDDIVILYGHIKDITVLLDQ